MPKYSRRHDRLDTSIVNPWFFSPSSPSFPSFPSKACSPSRCPRLVGATAIAVSAGKPSQTSRRRVRKNLRNGQQQRMKPEATTLPKVSVWSLTDSKWESWKNLEIAMPVPIPVDLDRGSLPLRYNPDRLGVRG